MDQILVQMLVYKLQKGQSYNISINAWIVLSDDNHNIDDMTAISAAKVCQQRAQ